MIFERDASFQPRDLADWIEYFTERAAIFEFEAGLTRLESERAAAILAGPRPVQ